MISRKSDSRAVFLILAVIIFLTTPCMSWCEEPICSFAVLADHKTHHWGLEMALEFARSENIDFVMVPGDFDPIEKAYQQGYDKYGYGVYPDRYPDEQGLYLVMGNHDVPPRGDYFFRRYIAPLYPRNGLADAPLGTVYSFDRGNAHFVVTNQYIGISWGGYMADQLEWLENDLSISDQPFKFVFGHEPAFPMGGHMGNSLDIDPTVRDQFWNILVDNHVQAFFCGHTHHLSVIRKDGVFQIDVGEAINNHVSLTTVHLYPDNAVVRLYETERTDEVKLPEGTDIGISGVFRMHIVQENTIAINESASRVLYDSAVQPLRGSSSGCFIDLLTFNH